MSITAVCTPYIQNIKLEMGAAIDSRHMEVFQLEPS